MGHLVQGVWQDDGAKTSSAGRFVRADAKLRGWLTRDRGAFPAELGRYHLYVARACPWAHRAVIMRALKGLEGVITLSVTHWHMGEQGWTFDPGPGVVPDPVLGARYLHQIYTASDARYSGRVTVPVLWDKVQRKIVSNESEDILRMLGSAFDHLGARPGDYYPEELRSEIDAVNARVYRTVNNGVYAAGFASSQAAYEEAVGPLFETLDGLEERLGRQRWLCGDRITESDWRLFTTLVRFDLVYHGHFKCNVRRLVDYPRLWSLTRELFQVPGIAQTVDVEHIKRHYYESHRAINPTGITPVGPCVDFGAPPDRSLRGA